MSIWDLYNTELMNHEDYEYLIRTDELPMLSENQNNKEIVERMQVLSKQFKLIVRNALYPMKCCCNRQYSFFCCYKELFGTLDQMRYMLEKNFDGKQLWVTAHDGM